MSDLGSYEWIRGQLRRIFFPAHGASNPAVIRIALGLFVTHNLIAKRAKNEAVATMHPDQFVPKGLAHLLDAPIDPVIHMTVYDATIVLGVLFTLGLGYRVVSIAWTLLFLWVFSYRNSWGFLYHTQHLVFAHMAVMCFAPAADRFSLDSLVRRRFGDLPRVRSLWGAARHASPPHWRYGWPIQVLLLVTGICYWIAGVAKLDRGGGLGWATDQVLLDQIANNALRYIHLKRDPREVTFFLFQLDPRVVGAMSMASLALELCAPLMILHRRITVAYAIALYLFHRGVLMLMGIPFAYQLSGAAFVPFLRWDLIGSATQRHLHRAREHWRTRKDRRD